MNWEDEGYLLSKKKFRENAIIISAFTKSHGKISGIVYGGTSRKIKNYLQVGNKIFFILLLGVLAAIAFALVNRNPYYY